MSENKTRTRITLDSIAVYRIKVQGCLEESWSDRLAGMKITMDIQNYQNPITTLVGKVKDQAELIGVLNGLYELRMPLISIGIIEQQSP